MRLYIFHTNNIGTSNCFCIFTLFEFRLKGFEYRLHCVEYKMQTIFLDSFKPIDMKYIFMYKMPYFRLLLLIFLSFPYLLLLLLLLLICLPFSSFSDRLLLVKVCVHCKGNDIRQTFQPNLGTTCLGPDVEVTRINISISSVVMPIFDTVKQAHP